MTPDDLHMVALKAVDTAAAAVRQKTRRPANTTAARRFTCDPAAAAAEAERAIVMVLGAMRCDDVVALPGEKSLRHGSTGIRWIAEPLGGLTNLARGGSDYTVSVAALHRDAGLKAAAILSPGDTRWLATNEVGVTGSRPGRLSARTDLDDAVLTVGFPDRTSARFAVLRALDDLLPRVRDVRISGSPATDLMAVATGIVDAHIGIGLTPWDYVAGHGLVLACGGTAKVLRLRRAPAISIAANPGLALRLEDALRAALAK